jgi:hypothetical protein
MNKSMLTNRLNFLTSGKLSTMGGDDGLHEFRFLSFQPSAIIFQQKKTAKKIIQEYIDRDISFSG